MIEFGLPWVLLLLPVPLLVWWLWPAARDTGRALRVPFYQRVRALPGGGAAGTSARGLLALLVKAVAWLLLVAAAAQPQWMGEPQAVQAEGRDLMLALDLSGSMSSEDFAVQGRPIDRFSVVRAVARQFVLDRHGDRVGLVLFGTRAFLQAPVTPDLATVATLLDESEVGLAGEETAIGDAIGLAVKHLHERPADERVLVLLSDGVSNAGVLDPAKAATLAAEAGVRIYTIGVGSRGGAVASLFGQAAIPSGAELDETTLRAVADTTGGSYFRADDTESLLRVYAEIDKLEPTEGEAEMIRPVRALFFWPLGGTVALCGLLGLGRAGSELTSTVMGRTLA
jgi:Ca-activated chloride channel family protein